LSGQLIPLLLGLGAGAALAMLAMGVVITYRASGVINFAHAATGMWIAHVFYEFRETGDLVFPIPFDTIFGLDAPTWLSRVHLLDRPTVAAALIVALTYAALFGLAQYVLIFRNLRNQPALARVVASIGLFLYLWACVPLIFALPPSTRSILPTGSFEVLGELLFVDRFVILLIALALTAALWAFYKFTKFGLATTAAAENENGALLTGINADRTAAINWMISAALAGLAVILISRINSLDPLNLSLLIVPALAAALLGGMKSFGWVALAGIGIGMLQSWLVNLQSDLAEFSTLGLEQGLPFLIILIALIFRGNSLPTRGEVLDNKLPRSPEPRHPLTIGAIALGLGIVVMVVGSSDWRTAVITSGIAMMISLSIIVLTGFIGQISFAPFAFAGVAAFSLIKLGDFGVPFPIAPLVAALITAGLGVLLGIPAVRVRGMNLAIATLGAAVAIEQLLFKWEWFVGSTTVPDPAVGPVDLSIGAIGDAYPRGQFGALVVVVAVVATIAVANLRRGSTGLTWLAVRANERAAAAAGVDVTGAKLAAFGISAFLAALGGTLLAYQRTTLTAAGFTVFASLAAIAVTYLAGITSVSGGVVAGMLAPLGLFALLSNGGELPIDVSNYSFAINGLLLIVAAVLIPSGITGVIRDGWHKLRDRADRPSQPDLDAASV
jgi:branched-chain amino acid transport system permease protein